MVKSTFVSSWWIILAIVRHSLLSSFLRIYSKNHKNKGGTSYMLTASNS